MFSCLSVKSNVNRSRILMNNECLMSRAEEERGRRTASGLTAHSRQTKILQMEAAIRTNKAK